MDNKIKKLNLGSGEDKKEEYVNIDFNPLTNPDVLHDLNVYPYPFENSSFDEIFASHILEHLDKPFEVMKEFHRLLKPGGKLILKVPHFSRAFTHAEHAHGFDVSFPLYFKKNFTSSGYVGVEFELVKMKLSWMAFFHLLKYFGIKKWLFPILKTLNYCINFLANFNLNFCSRIWYYWVGGFEEISYEFKCKK